MLPTGLTLADFELRVGLAILAFALALAAAVLWRRQFGRPSNSKSPRR
jgi:hypothetical protein